MLTRRAALELLGSGFTGALLCGLTPALAETRVQAFTATLAADQRAAFEAWYQANVFWDAAVDAFWDHVASKRSDRRHRKARGEALTADHYVPGFPPPYTGPQLPPEIAKAWAQYQAAQNALKPPPPPPKPIPTLNDMLAAASQYYGFVPEQIPERAFKQRYAGEALRLGLTKAQVVRVYALETSGIGTADMQAGIHPLKRTGKEISTALGYAQLLAANSINELVKHGPAFIERLDHAARLPATDPARAKVWAEKAAVLRRILAKVRSVPNEWERHVALAQTPEGLGIHTINLDGDIGPWLQVVKLVGLRDEAAKAGRSTLAPNELELMNLAGPATALEMMLPVGLQMSTPNFFSRGAYNLNTVVRSKTAAELLAALDKRMDENMVNPGAVEFQAAFDAITGALAGR